MKIIPINERRRKEFLKNLPAQTNWFQTIMIWCLNSPDQVFNVPIRLLRDLAKDIPCSVPSPDPIGFPRKLKEQHPIKWSRGAMFLFRWARRGSRVYQGEVSGKFRNAARNRCNRYNELRVASWPRRFRRELVTPIEPARDRRPGILIFLARGGGNRAKRPLYEKSRWW